MFSRKWVLQQKMRKTINDEYCICWLRVELIVPSVLFSNFAREMKCNMGIDGDLFMCSKSKVVQVYTATNEPCFFE